MEDCENRELMMRRLQDNLSSLRKIAGWSVQDLCDRLGVTKQTVSNLENGKTPMSVTQFIAISAIIDNEIFRLARTDPENTLLSKAVYLCMNYDADDPANAQAMTAMEMIANSYDRMPEEKLNAFAEKMLPPVLGTVGLLTLAGLPLITMPATGLLAKKIMKEMREKIGERSIPQTAAKQPTAETVGEEKNAGEVAAETDAVPQNGLSETEES